MQIFKFIAEIVNSSVPEITPTLKLINPIFHPAVNSTNYAWNAASLFGLAAISLIFGVSLFYLPKYFYRPHLNPFYWLFTWVGGFLILDGAMKLNYTLILLNLDRTVPWLYFLLTSLRILESIVGFIATSLFLLIYSRIPSLNKLEEDAERHKKQFSALVDSSRDAIVVANKKSIILIWNEAAERIFGYTQKEAVDSHLNIIIPPYLREAHRVGMERYLTTGDEKLINITIEINAIHKSGNEFPVELSLSKYILNGETYFTSIIRDISSRKKLEKVVNAASTILGTPSAAEIKEQAEDHSNS